MGVAEHRIGVPNLLEHLGGMLLPRASVRGGSGKDDGDGDGGGGGDSSSGSGSDRGGSGSGGSWHGTA